MMENFVIYNPVKLHFGQGVTEKLGKSAVPFGGRALLLYGRGSVKDNGAWQQSRDSLERAGIRVVEYSGIKSNPIVEDADEAAALGRREGVDMVVAVGGGSVLDTAKFVALAIPAGHSCWHFATGEKKPVQALPVLGVLTLAATGSEMNAVAVIQNDKEKKKIGYGHPLMFPRHSFLDPTFTLSVPANYTAYGIVDLVAHALEGWFGEGEASLTDRFILSIIREALEYGPKLMQSPGDYTLRAKIMHAATMALNGLTVQGKKSGDWGVHSIGHAMSVLWDIPHGASLSIAYPAWLRLQQDRIPGRIHELGSGLFGSGDAGQSIEQLASFFHTLGSPLSLSEAGTEPDQKAKQALFEVMTINKVDGIHHKLSEDDYRWLIDQMA